MANLASLKRTRSLTDGAWKRPNPDLDLEILTRGFTDEYYDTQAARQRKAAAGFGGDTDKLPTALKRRINAQTLIDKCLIDARLKDDDGNPVQFAEFCELILNPDYPDLTNAAFAAAAMVTSEREADLADVEGN